MSGLRDNIKNYFSNGDAVIRLIMVNLGFFIAIILLAIFASFFKSDFHNEIVYNWLALPDKFGEFIFRPWTLFTYMFTHNKLGHIFFNMLVLFFFGRTFLQYLGGRRLLSTYILGGLAGGILYVLVYSIFPAFSDVTGRNIGASAGVVAIVVAISAYVPNLEVRLMFLPFRFKLWWIGAFFVLTDLVYIPEGDNVGGHLAHIGGALLGYFFVRQLRNNKDITEGFSRFMDRVVNWFSAKPKMQKVYSKPGKRTSESDDQYNTQKVEKQERMNEILDKISRSGYESLTKDEKDYLFRIGKE